MMRSVFSMVVAGALSLGAVGSAIAQDACQTAGRLTQAVGSVMVDKGAGFTPAVLGASLVSGDRVSVLGQGKAVVEFGNDRTITVASSTTEIVKVPGCGVGLTNSGTMNPALGIATTLAAGVGLSAAISAADSSNGTIIIPVSP